MSSEESLAMNTNPEPKIQQIIGRRISGKIWKYKKTATRRSQLSPTLRKNWDERIKERTERETMKKLENELKEEQSSSNKVILGKRSHTESIEKEENNNGQMHSRNRYRNNPPDFAVLAFKYSSFYPYGTGASCIYPLLACTLNKNWVMLATEIDEKSVEYAENNVLRNNLENKISVVLNKTDKKILLSEEVMINNNIRFAFCMCNPPFYESQEQYEKGVEIKQTPPLSVCNGTSREKFTPGGEFQFIKDILDESLVLRNKIRWYTSKIGRLETVNKIVRELKRTGIDNYVVTEFCQGQTRRWGIGWSFGSQRPPTNIINQTSKKLRKISQPKTEFCFGIPADSHDVIGCILVHLNELDIDGNFNDENGTFFGSAKTNTWSQPWKSNATNTKVTFSWTDGKDRNVFESFYSHVKKWLEQKFAVNDQNE
ncbi:2890_t:CDS:10 [Diversispora eburnea]|uniref:2890_t:CDS:1 n=1 Tax=Diversispora eburnea TaxID=1213867 RepID=A0A9N8YS37_9GLOM|nr:2890_t:CDS:10 [Diversispora eburnea]